VRGRRRAATFDWDRSAAATIRCYQNAIAAARARDRGRLPADVRQTLLAIAESPIDDGRELASWTERCLHTEAHLRTVEADRAEILARLNELEQKLGRALTSPKPPPTVRPRWSLKRRLGKIKAGIKRRLGE
jgi:hypothetical protein